MTGPTNEGSDEIRRASNLVLKAGYLVAFVGNPTHCPPAQYSRRERPSPRSAHNHPANRLANVG